MAQRPELSKGELEIARVVWDLGEATLGQVFEACLKERKIDYATVQTYLNRLVTKGYLKTRPEGRTKLYRPKVQPSQVIRETVNDLLKRLFGGNTSLLVRHLIDDDKLTAKDVQDLRGLLNKLEAEAHDNDD
jgi:BlaI family transcriptional regulator, penicillinase repressor